MCSASEFSPLSSLNAGAIENVFVYICDALRWDFRPDRVVDRGVTLRTAAHGLYTPPGMASIVTGRYPPRHGAIRFETPVPVEQDTIFDIEDTNSGFGHNQWEGHPVFDLLRQSVGPRIGEIEPPFVYVEHDHGAHAPYPNLDADVGETFSRLSRRPKELRDHYREGVDASVDRFLDRLETLEARGVRDSTLVIFTSDHGELLGEHGGFVGHSLPAAPELVYVPTIFIHPSLDPAEHDDALIEQADLFPTVRDVMNDQPPAGATYDGRSLLSSRERDRRAYNHGIVHFPGEGGMINVLDPVYDARSVWTRDGGHVFVNSGLPKRLLTGLYDTTRSTETGSYNRRRNLLRSLGTLLPMYLPASRTFGEPTLTRSEAREYCNNVLDRSESEISELSQETVQQLEHLGYR